MSSQLLPLHLHKTGRMNRNIRVIVDSLSHQDKQGLLAWINGSDATRRALFLDQLRTELESSTTRHVRETAKNIVRTEILHVYFPRTTTQEVAFRRLCRNVYDVMTRIQDAEFAESEFLSAFARHRDIVMDDISDVESTAEQLYGGTNPQIHEDIRELLLEFLTIYRYERLKRRRVSYDTFVNYNNTEEEEEEDNNDESQAEEDFGEDTSSD